MLRATSTPTSEPYLAAQVTCLECGFVETIMRRVRDPWLDPLGQPRECAACDSKLVQVPQWWPVDDPRLVILGEVALALDRLRFKES